MPRGKGKKPVLMYDMEGNFIREFISVTATAEYFNTMTNVIQDVLRGRRNHHRKFVFKYKNPEDIIC